jgi:thioredoxin reductase
MTSDCLIIGAGPYGLSLAAHMRKAGTDFRIVGDPMEPWRTAMPSDMHLKSEGFASTLFEPSQTFTLAAYCAEQGIPYADIGVPVAVDTFVKYGQEFQRRCVPEVENRTVTSLARSGGSFQVGLQDGGTISARRVIVASGILPYAWVPEPLAGLPESICTHSSAHHDFSCFKGRNVVVLGAGASAMDVAASLHNSGAAATVVARRPVVRFQTPLGSRSLMERLRAPMTPVGPGWKSVLCTKAPLLFHRMPRNFRVDVVRRYLGPAPAWFIRETVEMNVPIMSGTTIESVNVTDGKAILTLSQGKSATKSLTADHVIAATGYRVDIQRLNFLDARLRTAMRCDDGAPRLSRHFESSIPGLYFIGTAAANSFGPMLRFACGAGFVARRLSRHLAASGERRSSRNAPQMQTRAVAADG